MARSHRCSNNDHISKIAADNDFRDWETVWNANRQLQRQRNNPNLLFKGDRRVRRGDRLQIPNQERREEGAVTEADHEFEARDAQLFLRLRILKPDFTPLSGAQYRATIEGVSDPYEATTGDNGEIELGIPRTAQRGQLVVRVPAAAVRRNCAATFRSPGSSRSARSTPSWNEPPIRTASQGCSSGSTTWRCTQGASTAGSARPRGPPSASSSVSSASTRRPVTRIRPRRRRDSGTSMIRLRVPNRRPTPAAPSRRPRHRRAARRRHPAAATRPLGLPTHRRRRAGAEREAWHREDRSPLPRRWGSRGCACVAASMATVAQ
jgi:hypothetical protein